MLTDVIDEYGVYSNRNLKEFIYGLESRFAVTDEVEFFSRLVNFSENRDAPYHGWFKYREGFSHTLVRELLSRCGISEDEYVLDPFCGSGTTVVEAALNGYSGIGIDINPVSAFLSRVKCRSYTDEELVRLRRLLPELVERMRQSEPEQSYLEKYQEVRKFFNDHHFRRLLSVRQELDKQKGRLGTKLYEFLLCAYICIIEDVSDRKRDGNGLKKSAAGVREVEAYYLQKSGEMLSDIERYRISPQPVSILACGDAKKLQEIVGRYAAQIGRTPGAIMYSPPYANSFDYFESYKMEVILADYAPDKKGIGVYRQQAVESFVRKCDERNGVRDFVSWMADEIEEAIPEKEERTGKRDGRTRKVPKMLKGYFADMEKVIEESGAILRPGKKCYIVVDQSAYLGRIVPTDLFLAAIAEHYGFRVREIIVCRIAKTAGQQVQRYPYLKDSLRESIVVLEKR